MKRYRNVKLDTGVEEFMDDDEFGISELDLEETEGEDTILDVTETEDVPETQEAEEELLTVTEE
jgi:hypothetical protein